MPGSRRARAHRCSSLISLRDQYAVGTRLRGSKKSPTERSSRSRRDWRKVVWLEKLLEMDNAVRKFFGHGDN